MLVPTCGDTAELRERILELACACFAERGYAGTTIREVAEAAGCTKPALYYYFRSKEALFLEAIGAEHARVTATIEPVLRGGGTVRERMVGGLRAFFALVAERPAGLTLLMRAEAERGQDQPQLDYRSMRELHLAMATALLEDGVRSGEMRADLPVEDAVSALVGAIDQHCRRFLLDGVPLSERGADRIVEFFMEGAAA